MDIAGSHIIIAPPEKVWATLLNPIRLSRALSGCRVHRLQGTQFHCTLTIPIGPLAGKYTGHGTFSQIDEPNSFHLLLEGSGAGSTITAVSTVQLEDHETATTLHYQIDANVTGSLAELSPRLLHTSANALIRQSFEGLERELADKTAVSHPPPPSDPPTKNAVPPIAWLLLTLAGLLLLYFWRQRRTA